MLRIVGFLQFGASIPLGIFSVSIVSRLQFLRVNVAGVYIALFGGLAASLFLALSGLATWMLSQAGMASDTGALRAWELFGFATGGFGNIAATGLLLAGVSVPSLFLRLLPRWVCWLGLVIAVASELSTIGLLTTHAYPLLPISRFPSLLWLVVVGFFMPRRRMRHSES